MRTLRSYGALVIGVFVALVVTSAAGNGIAWATVAAAQQELGERWLWAHMAATDLATAYVDQETGQRGFLLTGDEQFLEPYAQGRDDADWLQRRLADTLGDDEDGLRLLTAVRAAGEDWVEETAEPGIAARRQGPLAPEVLEAQTTDGKVRFDALRAQLAALEDHVDQHTAAQLDAIGRAQTTANVVAITAAALALVAAVAAVPLRRRVLSAPLERLQADVQAVAAGDYDRPITLEGPRELVTIAEAVERMRAGVLEHSRRRMATQRELTLREEHDRMAADLHDLTIQRIFGLGLRLASVGRRHPDMAPAVKPLVEETDRIIRELRTVIFDLGRSSSAETLRGRVIDVADESARALGFTPTLEFSGAVDTLTSEATSDEVLAVLREALSNAARHARATAASVRLAAHDGALSLTVTDNGVGLSPGSSPGKGLTNLRARAERLGGSARIGPGADGVGTVVEWRVPLRS